MIYKGYDINFNDNTISIERSLTKDTAGKTKLGITVKTYRSKRILTLEPFIMAIFKKHIQQDYILNEQKLLFYNPKNTYYTVSQVNSAFKRFC